MKICGVSTNKRTKEEAKNEANIQWIQSAYNLLNYNYREYKIVRDHFENYHSQQKRIQEKTNNRTQHILTSIENVQNLEQNPRTSSKTIENTTELTEVENQCKTKQKQEKGDSKEKQTGVQTKE